MYSGLQIKLTRVKNNVSIKMVIQSVEAEE